MALESGSARLLRCGTINMQDYTKQSEAIYHLSEGSNNQANNHPLAFLTSDLKRGACLDSDKVHSRGCLGTRRKWQW